jgi:hypothetical protein
MSKKTEMTFQEKFKDRMENMGKDGIIGVMKNTENPINKIEIDKMEKWNNLYNESNKNKMNTSRFSNDSKINSSKISSNGQMIMANKNNSQFNQQNVNNLSHISNNNNLSQFSNISMVHNGIQMPTQINNMQGMPMQMQMPMPINNMQGMPMYNPIMNPYYNMNNQMMMGMGYNYMNQHQQFLPQVQGYNPYMMQNLTPLNNYNKNISNNFNNNINRNQPVKILPSQTESHSKPQLNPIIEESSPLDKSKVQRSMSSRSKVSKNPSDNSVLLNNGRRINLANNIPTDNGPSTNPDSFRNKNRDSSYTNNSHFNDDGTYKPYTLKEYKELSSAKIVMGKLGPNLGTKEWEDRQQKLKKMEEYANELKSMHKNILKIKKESPMELAERQKKEKLEYSSRNKSYEYSKLIKPKNKEETNYSEQNNNYSERITSGKQREIEESKSKFMIDYHNRNKNNNENNIRYTTDNDGKNNNNFDIDNMKKQREMYNLKINEIKESLLK